MGKLRTLEVENVEDLFLNQMFYRRLFWLCWDRDIDSVYGPVTVQGKLVSPPKWPV